MRKIEEILRLRYQAGLSHRQIAQSCAVSASTVGDCLTHAQAAGRMIPQPDWAKVHQELRCKGVTLSLLWIEYRQAHANGYGYSQFCYHYGQWAKQLKPNTTAAPCGW